MGRVREEEGGEGRVKETRVRVGRVSEEEGGEGE